MTLKRRHQAGFGLPIVIILSLALGILTIALAKWIRDGSFRTTYLVNMKKTHELAEKGRDAALGMLSHDASITTHGPINDSELAGEYQTRISPTTFPAPANFYLVTSATRTVGGKVFSSRLHTYAQVTDIGGYFAAVTDMLTISHPVNFGNGAVYGLKINFLSDGFGQTMTILRKAQFFDNPTTNNNLINEADCWPPNPWNATFKTVDVAIAEPLGLNQPIALTQPLLLPQLLDQDVDRYDALAHGFGNPNSHRLIDAELTGHLFPPGYRDGQITPDDTYANHTDDNEDHVYFSTTVVRISSVVVHGQVVIFSRESIYLSSDVVSAPLGSALPGNGSTANHASSSTAHQLILITLKDVVVGTATYSNTVFSTVTIHAFIIAPKGTFRPESYADTSIHSKLFLDFTGGLILKSLSSGNNFPAVFNAGRSYSYMESMRTNPPPYLPPASQVIYSFHQVGSGSVY